jgi:hypothetical protein
MPELEMESPALRQNRPQRVSAYAPAGGAALLQTLAAQSVRRRLIRILSEVECDNSFRLRRDDIVGGAEARGFGCIQLALQRKLSAEARK